MSDFSLKKKKWVKEQATNLGKGFYYAYNWQRISMRTYKEFLWINKRMIPLCPQGPWNAVPEGWNSLDRTIGIFLLTQLSYSGECIRMESPPRKKRNCFDYRCILQQHKINTENFSVSSNRQQVRSTGHPLSGVIWSLLIINEAHIHNIKQSTTQNYIDAV